MAAAIGGCGPARLHKDHVRDVIVGDIREATWMVAPKKENVLHFIPGDYISAAGQTLPDAATDAEAFREVEIDVADWFRAPIRFKR
jgi:hypothetical protein